MKAKETTQDFQVRLKAEAIITIEGPMTIENLKESCIKVLKEYIASRGSINEEGKFKGSFLTRKFRDEALTLSKVGEAQSLIEVFEKAERLNDVQDAMRNATWNPGLVKGSTTKGFEFSMYVCTALVQEAERYQRQEEDLNPPSGP